MVNRKILTLSLNGKKKDRTDNIKNECFFDWGQYKREEYLQVGIKGHVFSVTLL